MGSCFTSQYHESSIPGGEGLYFYNARWYDGKLGRFLSADTLVPGAGNPQSFNRYSYVLNNPLKYVDPSGHASKDVGLCMCGGGAHYGGMLISNTDPEGMAKIQRFLLNAAGAVPYLDTGEDFLVATTGCGYACQVGYEEKAGWGWRAIAGLGIVLPIGYRSVKLSVGAGEEIAESSSLWLGKWLDKFEIEQGFSGVFDPASEVFNLRPSANRADLPVGWVPQYLGHDDVNRELARINSAVNPKETVGFVVIKKGIDGLEVRWNSLSVNGRNWQGRAVPVQFRQTIIETLAAWTGLKITSQ